jgi:glycosyltransferase involved in cell wall biosynthesis
MTSSPASDRQLRVVFVNHCARPSGAEIAMLRLLPALVGVDAHVVLAEDGPLVGLLRREGISTEVLAMPARARDLRRDRVGPLHLPVRSAMASAAYTIRLARRLRRLRPDLVETNSLKACYYGTVAGRLAGVPVVWHARDRIAVDYLPAPAVRLTRFVARWLPAAVVANSSATMATLPPARRRRRHRVDAVVPDAYQPVQSAEEREPAAGDPLVVGMVGRIAAWKGQHLAVAAFARAFPDSEDRLLLAGEAMFGEDDYRDRLRQDIERLGMAARIELCGHIDDVEAFLAGIDVLVHASTIPEPFGQVVVEGMAAGVPVVAADAGGPAEIITSGDDGLLVAPGDAVALGDALRRLAADTDLRRDLGRSARRTAARYAPAGVARQIISVYEEILGRRSGADAGLAQGPADAVDGLKRAHTQEVIRELEVEDIFEAEHHVDAGV